MMLTCYQCKTCKEYICVYDWFTQNDWEHLYAGKLHDNECFDCYFLGDTAEHFVATYEYDIDDEEANFTPEDHHWYKVYKFQLHLRKQKVNHE